MTAILAVSILPPHNWQTLLSDWGDDGIQFVRYQVPKIVVIAVICYVLVFILRWISNRAVQVRANRLPPGVRAAKAPPPNESCD